MVDEKHSAQIIVEENQRLKSAVAELSVLNEIAIAIASTKSLEQIIQLIIQKCVKHLHVEQGAVMLLDSTDRSNTFHTFIRKQNSDVTALNSFHLDTQLSGWMILHKSPLLVNDFENDARIRFIEKRADLKSILAVPLLLKNKLIGVVTLFNKKDESLFSDEDQRLLSIIAAQSAQVIENARLALREQTLIRVQEEMKLANRIQNDLMPKEIPQFKGYQLAGRSIPAKEIGGDYFDFVKMEDGSVAFCIADVSGKGLPAALLMANLQATLRGQAFLKASPTNCISFANNLLYTNTDSSKYATLFYGILNTKENIIKYCNAGHNPPFLFNNKSWSKRLDIGGVVVGMLPNFPFQEGNINMNKNDLLILYSDGVTEAMNAREEEFGEEKMLNIIRTYLKSSSDEIMQKILDEVKEHSKGVEQSDDITIMVIKRIE